MSEFIAKLSPQSCNPVRLGGVPELTSVDVAHACSMTNRIGYLIICIKYGGDNSGFAALQSLLSDRVMDEAIQDRWKRSRLPGLIKLAVIEYCSVEALNDCERAKYLKIRPSTYYRIWKSKYKRLIVILEAYELSAIHLVKNRLK